MCVYLTFSALVLPDPLATIIKVLFHLFVYFLER